MVCSDTNQDREKIVFLQSLSGYYLSITIFHTIGLTAPSACTCTCNRYVPPAVIFDEMSIFLIPPTALFSFTISLPDISVTRIV